MIKSLRLINSYLSNIVNLSNKIKDITLEEIELQNEYYTLLSQKKELTLSKTNEIKKKISILENIFENTFLYKGNSYFETFVDEVFIEKNENMNVDKIKGILTYGIKNKFNVEINNYFLSKNKKEIYIFFKDYIDLNSLTYSAYNLSGLPIYLEDAILYLENEGKSFYEPHMNFFEQKSTSFSTEIFFKKSKVNSIKLIFAEPVDNFSVSPFLITYEDNCNIVYKFTNENISNSFTINKHSYEPIDGFKYEFSFDGKEYKQIDFENDSHTHITDDAKSDYLYIKISSNISKSKEKEKKVISNNDSGDDIKTSSIKYTLSQQPVDGSIQIVLNNYDLLNSIIENPDYIYQNESGEYLFDEINIKYNSILNNADRVIFNNYNSFSKLKNGISFIYSKTDNSIYMPAILSEFDITIRYKYEEEVDNQIWESPILYNFTIKSI